MTSSCRGRDSVPSMFCVLKRLNRWTVSLHNTCRCSWGLYPALYEGQHQSNGSTCEGLNGLNLRKSRTIEMELLAQSLRELLRPGGEWLNRLVLCKTHRHNFPKPDTTSQSTQCRALQVREQMLNESWSDALVGGPLAGMGIPRPCSLTKAPTEDTYQ